MDAFVAWNMRLLESFFSPASEGEEVWLSVDAEELDAIGPDLGGDAGFLEAVKTGPRWPTIRERNAYARRGEARDFTKRAEGLCEQRTSIWHRPGGYVDPGQISALYVGCAAPAYLPMLAALVRASASQDNDGFYSTIRRDLALDSAWGPPDMAQLEELWADLESWTADQAGRFGVFKYRQLGGFRRVGVPRSQSIISRQDARSLTRVFAQAGVKPGQRASESLLSQVLACASDSYWLSRPLREALGRAEYERVLRDRLRQLLDEWDGSVFEPRQAHEAGHTDTALVELELQVALVLSQGNQLPWRVRWRVPSIGDSGDLIVRHEGTDWLAPITGEEFLMTSDGPVSEAARLLGESARAEVDFELLQRDEGSTAARGTGRSVSLAQRPLRTFVVEQLEEADGSATVVMLERPLPANGPAYMLATPQNAANLRGFLGRGLGFQPCPCDGLPEGWQLLNIPDCAALDDEARDHLPDGRDAHPQPRTLRFVGGRAIQRGGIRQYLPYDLPDLELDARPGTILIAEGIDLVERAATPTALEVGAAPSFAQLSSLRRFSIEPRSGAKSFLIQAIVRGEQAGSIKLRLAPEGGLVTASTGAASVDASGSVQQGTSGVRGVIVGADVTGTPSPSTPLTISLARPVTTDEGESLSDRAAVEFLDSLAQHGSIAYGNARDQLRRLVRKRGGTDRDALTVLRELHATGHLEIEGDSKGRWTRVLAVPPALYLLPVRDPAGHIVAAPGGTLRRGHWLALSCPHSGEMRPELDASVPMALPALRLVATSTSALGELAASLGGIDVVESPSSSILAWSVDASTIRSSIEESGVESLGSASLSALRFDERTGEFVPARHGVALVRQLTHELFQFDDLETGHHKLFSLGFKTDGGARYGFVRDPRWGTWLAVGCFGAFLRDNMRITDAAPWPIAYSLPDRTLWLPWHLRPPVLLERALAVCSGTPAIRVRACKGESRAGEAHDTILLDRCDAPEAIGPVSCVYSDYVPTYPRWATWLGYRWVPRPIAEAVAERLGARVDVMRT